MTAAPEVVLLRLLLLLLLLLRYYRCFPRHNTSYLWWLVVPFLIESCASVLV